MRIVVTSLLNPWDTRHGGGQLSTHNLAFQLGRRGHDVTVVWTSADGCRPKTAPGDLPYRSEFLPHHERLYLIPLEFDRWLGTAHRDIDVLHTKTFTGAFYRIPARRRVGRAGTGSARTARIATTHHPDPPDLTSPPAWTRPVDRARWTRLKVLALLERRALRAGDAVVCVSHHSAEILGTRGYLRAGTDVRVVHNGSPLEGVVRPGNRGAGGAELVSATDGTGATPRLLCVARLDGHKGIDVLFDALRQISDLPTFLDLIGTGLDEEALRKEADRLGVSDRVRWRGFATREEVAAEYAKGGVLVLPSRSENFPLVILEAMHVGLPMVATSVGGIPEAVRDGVEALLVPPGDAAALAGALRRVLEDHELRETLARNALARARDFTWARQAERMEQVYLEVRG